MMIVAEKVMIPAKSISRIRDFCLISSGRLFREAGRPYTATMVQKNINGTWQKKDLQAHMLILVVSQYAAHSPSPSYRVRQEASKGCSHATTDDIHDIFIASIDRNFACRDEVYTS